MNRDNIDALADRLVAAVEHGDEAALLAIYAPELEFVLYTDGETRDRAAAIRSFVMLRSAMHDVALRVFDRQLTEGGYVSQQVLDFTAPDGTRMSVPHCLIVRVRGGRIVRIDEYLDSEQLAPLLAQLAPAA
jgi:ketosteroid isomerase-like protein